MMMKKSILIFSILFMGIYSFAQTTDDYIEITRSVLQVEKKAAIAEVMELTEKEAEVFWPLYNELETKRHAVQTKRIQIIRNFAEHYEALSDEKADQIWTDYIQYKEEILKINKQYFKKFKKIISAGKAVRYFQAENKIAVLIDFQLSTEIPFIETKQ